MKDKLLFLVVSIATACASPEKVADPVPNHNPVMYEIFVQSFADSDGDGIGDIPGMTSKLDYLEDLGIGGIWLMPINPSPSYHKYDVTDYYDIHSDYGTLDDFKVFVQEAHARDIKIVMDMVINHSSDEHPDFLASARNEDLYRGYYVWADRDSVAEQIEKSETSFDSGNITQWHAFEGDTTKEHYYGFFTGDMPDMNFDYQPVRDEVLRIAEFWLSEVGVDGFRLDAAKHIYPDERVEDNIAFWEEYLQSLQSIKPEVYTVGEVWSNTAFVSEFVGGFSALFNFDLAFSILESVKSGTPVTASIEGHGWKVEEGSFINNLVETRQLYQRKNPDYEDAIFLSNHDQNRFLDVLGGDEDQAKLAVNILMTLPGRPYIYYGEEIGMHGMKPDPNIREPFLWDLADNDGIRASWIDPEFSTDETVIPLTKQVEDKSSMYNHYKTWIALRKDHAALHSGQIRTAEVNSEGILAFYRAFEGDELLVIHNLTTEDTEVQVPVNVQSILKGEAGSLEADKLTLKPLSTVILK